MSTQRNILAILVTYNGLNWLDTSLASLIEAEKLVDIAVVDNNSSDGTRETLSSKYANHIKYMYLLDENLGFGKAHNQVFTEGYINEYDQILLLNQDAAIDEGSIQKLSKAVSLIPTLGIVSPIHYFSEGVMDAMFKRYYEKPATEESEIDGLAIRKVSFVNAAIWLFRRELLQQVGCFNSIFDHYGEDSNFVHRVAFAGYEIGIVKNATGFHYRPQVDNGLATKARPDQFYIAQLIRLSNPAVPYSQALLNSFTASCREGIKLLLQLDLRSFILHSRLSLRILRKLSIIKDNRELGPCVETMEHQNEKIVRD